ncbi:TetR/AcrR family transcriptional regulator [Brevibacterium atlanticum]|uniref:TetR/AcrR family transcriptional regulator n=1 Tax=Brevibacterium atlanticum TaxID=2697563 RepID=UPI001423CCC5|nr:TetR/AcrR family transcriptional regulator [Brevibacterium atlanticum]
MAEDPRQTRAREALTKALRVLLEDEQFSSISVALLCETAGVHRTTFYKHASTLDEFAVDVVTRELDKISTVTRSESDGSAIPAYGKAMVDVLDHVAGERVLFRSLLESRLSGALRAAIDTRMQSRVRIALEVFEAEERAVIPDGREHVVAFLSGALVGTIMQWAMSDESDAVTWAARTQALMPPWWPVR